MLENGQVCVKTAGRDSGKVAVVIDQIDDKYVLIDGQVRRKKCNRLHLEPLGVKIKVKPSASTEVVAKELKHIGVEVIKTKPKKPEEKPTKLRKHKNEEAKGEKKVSEDKNMKDVKKSKKTATKKKTAEKVKSKKGK